MRGNSEVIGLALALFLAAISLSSPANAAAARSAPNGSAATRHREIVLRCGDSLDRVLARAGVAADQRQAAESALQDRRDPRRLQAGSRILLTLRPEDDGRQRLIALHIDLDKYADVTLVAGEDGSFDPPGEPPPGRAAADGAGHSDLRSVTGIAGPDFEASLLAAGLPPSVAREVREAFVYDPDFPARPPAGSRFDILFAAAPHSAAVGTSDALWSVAVTIHGREHSVYRYRVGHGLIAFVAPNGRGVLRAHLAKPVPDARISSPWGWRIHPILDRPEFHKGIDMAAPMGTPVRAAADGTVAFAGRHGNNGVLIKLEHTGPLMTAYSHLQRIAAGLHVGSHVTRDQVIGYVGETGLATGPHLYYEVFIAGKQVNPARKNIAVTIHLAGSALRRFRRVVVADSRSSLEELPETRP